MLAADIEAGAPVNADGTLNLVHYGDWLVLEMSRGDGSTTTRTDAALPAAQNYLLWG